MEYYNDILCVSGQELIKSESNPNGIISKPLFDKWKRDGVKVARRGCNGQTALIEFNSIPYKYRNQIAELLGVPEEQATVKTFKDKVIADAKAVTYFSNYTLADGRHLPDATQREYSINAAILNAIKEMYTNTSTMRKSLGQPLKGFWEKAIVAVNNLRAELKHNLPSKATPLKRKYQKYISEGYAGIISGKYCNDNSRKVNSDLERLIMSIYAMPNKPFASQVHNLYTLFLSGKLQVADNKSGEIFDPANFIKNGEPLEISESTVWNYLNMPDNRMIVDKVRMGAHRYNNTHRPHHHRHAPNYAFSKISMDDRDLPRKCVNGKWVKAYYSYDVTSGCVIGYAYSMHKNEELFLDCMRDMFRLIERENFGMPLEVEVENHLVNKFFDDLAIMFPFIRICNPGNSQEKHAEHLNRAKKYSVERNTQNGIGRWWSKHDAWTVDRDKVNDEFVEKTFSYERLVADDIQACKDFNNQLHPRQKKYPGKTRWEVLVENMNPNTPDVPKLVVYKAIGNHTQTAIRRNQYATVLGEKYQIPSLSVLEKMTPNLLTVDAYYLPDGEGMISEVYLYQNGVYLCKATKIDQYNTSKAEQTDDDVTAYTNQSKIVSQFDARAKEGKQELASIVIVESKVIEEALNQEVEIIPPVEVKEESIETIIEEAGEIDYAKRALENL